MQCIIGTLVENYFRVLHFFQYLIYAKELFQNRLEKFIKE